jgi:hypothetical protein
MEIPNATWTTVQVFPEFEQTIRLFHEVKLLMGIHGCALASVIFMQEQTLLVEIQTVQCFPCHWEIAQICRIDTVSARLRIAQWERKPVKIGGRVMRGIFKAVHMFLGDPESLGPIVRTENATEPFTPLVETQIPGPVDATSLKISGGGHAEGDEDDDKTSNILLIVFIVLSVIFCVLVGYLVFRERQESKKIEDEEERKRKKEEELQKQIQAMSADESKPAPGTEPVGYSNVEEVAPMEPPEFQQEMGPIEGEPMEGEVDGDEPAEGEVDGDEPAEGEVQEGEPGQEEGEPGQEEMQEGEGAEPVQEAPGDTTA